MHKTHDMSVSNRIKRMETRLLSVLTRDHAYISKQIQKIRNKRPGKAQDKGLLRQLGSLENRIAASIREKQDRLDRRPAVTFPEELPITAKKDEIIEAVKQHQVLIISGDTGSGKSTQIPKMCLAAGQGIKGHIGCTQPRRIAASTISQRIADELGEPLGASVGYKIRFKDRTRKEGYIKIMTDGILLMETQQDRRLSAYDTLIIDEAHERSLNIDFLLGILKTLLPERPDLKLIITSATMDTEKFSKAFNDAPVIHVGGRMFPVFLQYMPPPKDLEEAGEVTYVDLAVKTVEKIRSRDRDGDILVFMPTEQDILETCDRLEGRQLPGTTVLPLFARLSAAEQGRVYTVTTPKIVVATNVAETSLTIPGIKYVIDTGLARISQYLPSTRTTSLPVSPISRSSADQRKGRCGRVQDGICMRLYSQEDYETRPEFTPPEILRSNLAEVILRMIFLNLGDVAAFPFIDKPLPKNIKDGFDLLAELGAIEKRGKTGSLTETGRLMARMPLDPRISRIILEARNEGCIEEASVVAAALCIQDPRERPLEKAAQADQVHAPFRDPDSDFLTLLNIWNRYHRSLGRLKTQNRMRKFCKQHFLSFPRMREWIYIKDQIRIILKEQRVPRSRAAGKMSDESLYAGIHKSILGGFLSNIAMKKDKNIYEAAKAREAMVFPGSVLFNKGCPWLVSAEMVKTSRLFARTTAKIDPRWLEPLGGDLCRRNYTDAHWEKNRGEVRAHEQVTLFGLPIVTRRPVSYGPINSDEAHNLFVQALVTGDIKDPPSFLKHNQALIKQIAALEDKVRRRDILAGEAVLADFYDQKLEGIYDIRTLKKLIKARGGDDFLKMQEQDLVLSYPEAEELLRYPDRIAVGSTVLDCFYKFLPGAQDDGVTVKIPQGLASGLPTEPLEWGVPGMLKEKVTALIKGLPKGERKKLVPVPDTVERVMEGLKQDDQALVPAIARFISQELGVDIPASAWEQVKIPEHLQTRVVLTDHAGREVHSGRDLGLLRSRSPATFKGGDSGPWKKARSQWEKNRRKTWDFGTLPEKIQIGHNLIAFPGLAPAGDDGVDLRLFENPDEALNTHQQGVQTLFVIHFKKELVHLKKNLQLAQDGLQGTAYFGGPKALTQALYQNILKRLFFHNIRSRDAFEAHAASVTPVSGHGKGLKRLTIQILNAVHHTQAFLYNLEKTNKSNQKVRNFCAQAREDLQVLLPSHSLDIYTEDRLAHLPRYLKALQIRAERFVHDPGKDQKKTTQVRVFIDAYARLAKNLSMNATSEKTQALTDLYWMIQEFKVSLFAQELKTPYPVSEKRLQTQIKKVEHLV